MTFIAILSGLVAATATSVLASPAKLAVQAAHDTTTTPYTPNLDRSIPLGTYNASLLTFGTHADDYCTTACDTFFMLKFDRRARPEHHDSDHNHTPHIALVAGNGGWQKGKKPINIGSSCVKNCDHDEDKMPGDTRIVKWVKLQCPHESDESWDKHGGGWERVDLEPIREGGLRPGIPRWIDVHGGGYCKHHPYTENVGHDMWIMYKGEIVDLPSSNACDYWPMTRLGRDPWIGRCWFYGVPIHYEG